MGSMHLQHVEPRTISAFGCRNEVRDHRVHVGARHFTRGWHCAGNTEAATPR